MCSAPPVICVCAFEKNAMTMFKLPTGKYNYNPTGITHMYKYMYTVWKLKCTTNIHVYTRIENIIIMCIYMYLVLSLSLVRR